MTDTIVHTIDSRGNIMLGVVQELFGLDNEQLRREIVAAVEYTSSALLARGVKYADLRSALTPQPDRQEIALLFDTTKINEGWYGLPVQQRLLPLLAPTSSHSILLGDLLGSNEQQPWIRSQLATHLQSSGEPFQFRYSTQFYCVYINNCSADMVRTFNEGLRAFTPYVGYADVTYSSRFKTYLSYCLVNGYIKHRRIIIQQHEDDLPDDTNQNTRGYPFEEAGFECRSIQGMYFGLLLSYKIERPVLAGSERDQVHALNAVSSQPKDIANCIMEIDERKLEYLNKAKTGTLRRLGVLGQPKATLEGLIRAKLRSTYLYNLHFRSDYSVATFNILLELQAIDTGEPVRVVASFAYEQERNAIRLVTLF
jgi:hypothetical protein